jgi:hypothetical protein
MQRTAILTADILTTMDVIIIIIIYSVFHRSTRVDIEAYDDHEIEPIPRYS